MADWVKRAASKGAIDRAGMVLAPWWDDWLAVNTPEVAKAIDVARNWRASHSYPLNAFQMNLRRRARRLEPDALVVSRMKRMRSVYDKLVREPNMKLSQMQDLGGCRAILSSVESVRSLAAMYGGLQAKLFAEEKGVEIYDYIGGPKADGYRGIHIVGRFSAKTARGEPWNGQRIEVQIRTHLQHAFATAVETVTTFTRQPLKFGGGPIEWRRFFSLMGSVLAIREGTATVDGTPTDIVTLRRELREVSDYLSVQRRLASWAEALSAVAAEPRPHSNWLVLVLDLPARTVRVHMYESQAEADVALSKWEQSSTMAEGIDAVQIGIKDVRDLKTAYPNYYADTGAFLRALNAVL